jgi:hypothetical protein
LFEQSARPKSDLYIDLLPLINSQRVELLDDKRLIAQLIGLERRTSRMGRDSVDHAPGGHDDCANAVAGLLVGLDLDRRPALVRQSDYLAGADGIDWPSRLKVVYAVVVADSNGVAAVCYYAQTVNYGDAAILLDFDTGYLSSGLLSSIEPRLREIAGPYTAAMIFAPEGLRISGIDCEPIPYPPQEFESLKIIAANTVAAGGAKMTKIAFAKGKECPLGGALEFRGGRELIRDPLRAAAVIGIALATPS